MDRFVVKGCPILSSAKVICEKNEPKHENKILIEKKSKVKVAKSASVANSGSCHVIVKDPGLEIKHIRKTSLSSNKLGTNIHEGLLTNRKSETVLAVKLASEVFVSSLSAFHKQIQNYKNPETLISQNDIESGGITDKNNNKRDRDLAFISDNLIDSDSYRENINANTINISNDNFYESAVNNDASTEKLSSLTEYTTEEIISQNQSQQVYDSISSSLSNEVIIDVNNVKHFDFRQIDSLMIIPTETQNVELEGGSGSTLLNGLLRRNLAATLTQSTLNGFVTSKPQLKEKDKSKINHYNHRRFLPNPKHCTQSGTRTRASIAKLYSRTLRPSSLQLHRVTHASGRGVSTRVGVSEIRFDPHGVLVAVSGSNGIIRIFDFECLLMAMRLPPSQLYGGTSVQPRKVQEPVLWLDTKRDISSIEWSPRPHHDELAVSFSFDTSVHIYDLSRVMSATAYPNIELKATGTTAAGGHTCLLYYRADGDAILAGGTYGHIRLWGLSQPHKPRWVVQSDPLVKEKGPGVVALRHVDSNYQSVISVTSSGIFAVWDVVHLTVGSFGSTGSPQCIHRLCFWDAFPAAILTNPSFKKFPAVGLSDVPGLSDEFCLTLSSSDAYIINLFTGGVTSCGHSDSDSLVPPTLKVLPQLIHSETDMSELRSREESQWSGAPHCRAVLPSWPSSKVCIVPLNGTCKLRFLEFPSSCLTSTPPSPRHPKSSSNQEFKVRKCGGYSLTLPGTILSATPGSKDVYTTHDLRDFLCGESVSHVMTGRSSRLKIHYYHQPLTLESGSSDIHNNNSSSSSDSNSDSTRNEEGGGDQRSGTNSTRPSISAFYRIDCVTEAGIRLMEMYDGPPISDSHPRVCLVTDLEVLFASSPDLDMQEDDIAVANVAGNNDSANALAKDLEVRCAVTALEAHPKHPYVIAGLFDDNIIILSPHES